MFETVITEDGSLSVRDPATGELYHNRAGAYTEALVNYIQPSGLLSAGSRNSKTLKVLDVCFGLGYNTLVMLAELAGLGEFLYDAVEIVAVETDQEVLKLIEKVMQSDKFHRLPNAAEIGNALSRFGESRFDIPMGSGSCNVSVDLKNGDVRKLVPKIAGSEAHDFDLVFHDPFSPRNVPELWTIDLFHCYRRLLRNESGLVLTYSAATGVRGGLSDAGFVVRRTSALGGKSGGTMGATGTVPNNSFVFGLSDDERMKLETASAVPYRDASFNTARHEILSHRLLEQDEFKRRLNAKQPRNSSFR